MDDVDDRDRLDDRGARVSPVRHGTLVIDAANVVGSRPDGWWRDRPGAAARLLTALAASSAEPATPNARTDGDTRHGADADSAQAALQHRDVVVVLEGQAVAAAPDGWEGLQVVLAERDGDSAVVRVVTRLDGRDVVVVTSDRELRRRVEALGARVHGAGWLREALDHV